jgi:hypothetical protein
MRGTLITIASPETYTEKLNPSSKLLHQNSQGAPMLARRSATAVSMTDLRGKVLRPPCGRGLRV